MSRKATYASPAEKQRAYRERQKAKRNDTPVTIAEGEDLREFTGVPLQWAQLYGAAEARRLSDLARSEGIAAAREAAEDLAVQRGQTDALIYAALVSSWRKEFEPEVYEQLVKVADAGGVEAAGFAASAVRRALNWERGWQALRDWDATMQGHQLKRLVERKDPRIVQFLKDVHLC